MIVMPLSRRLSERTGIRKKMYPVLKLRGMTSGLEVPNLEGK